jgi:hypothetical protein
MENVQCHQLPKTEDDKSLAIDGGWWQVLWVFCFYIVLFLHVMTFLKSLWSMAFNLCMVFLLGELCVVGIIGRIFLVRHQSKMDGGGS